MIAVRYWATSCSMLNAPPLLIGVDDVSADNALIRVTMNEAVGVDAVVDVEERRLQRFIDTK